MILIPQVKFYSDDITDVVSIECLLKTINTGNMLYNIQDIISIELNADGTIYPLTSSKDKEHWFSCVNYKKLQLVPSTELLVHLPSKVLKFNVGSMHWEHV